MDDLFAQLETASPYVVVPLLLNAIGYILSKSAIENKHIPLFLALLGSLAFQVLHGWSPRDAIIGFVVGAAAVGFNQGLRQYTNKDTDEKIVDTPKS